MQQILQSLKTGETIVANIPCPQNLSTTLLIESACSLISSGTERMLREFGSASVIGKIKQQPDKVKMVFDKIKTDGLASTWNSVQTKLNQTIPLGYCNVGKIQAIGEKVNGFQLHDRVVSNAYHAEIVRISPLLCAKIPDKVSDEEAAFTVVAAIALQGIRLSEPTIGEYYVVIGLGLIGLLAVQLLIANGCRVLGVDFDIEKCALAKSFGAECVNLSNNEDLISAAHIFSSGRGVDSVIITASTQSDEPLHQAATICRKRGRIILIGVIGNHFSRADFYEKELRFQVSCSYGPGRYDPLYEQKNIDYPLGFVRWTQQRNFEAVLELIATGALKIKPLITHRIDFENVQTAYDILEKEKNSIGILIHYAEKNLPEKMQQTISTEAVQKSFSIHSPCIGFLGAGNYASQLLLPAFIKSTARLKTIVSSQGVSAYQQSKKGHFETLSTDETVVYKDKDINTVVIATRHDLHARQVIHALKSQKHVFVEKPLALTQQQLTEIQTAYEHSTALLMIGFNRRFAPLTLTIKKLLLQTRSPASFIMTVNAGHIDANHWTQQAEGGGRIIGEACHFIDLLRYLANSKIAHWHASAITHAHQNIIDTVTITLTFENGSLGTIHYFSNGNKQFPKEQLSVFCNQKILHLDNFKKLTGYGWKGFKKQMHFRQNKGQNECVAAFIDAIKNGNPSPIAFDEIIEVSKTAIAIDDFLRR